MTVPLTIADSEQAQRPDAPYDVERIRKDFPILHQKIHGKPLAYLDNAASAQKPLAVIDAVANLYRRDYSNIHRGLHELSARATKAYEDARVTAQRFVNATMSQEIVFVRGTTEAINLVAQTFGRQNVGAGDEILITAMEHHSNIVPWQMLCEEKGANLRVAPINDNGELIVEEFAKLLNNKTKLACVTHVSNALGTVNPARELIKIAHGAGVPVLVDAAQSAPHTRIDVQKLNCDFLAFSGHKVYGPSGVGILYGKATHLNHMPPYQGGGDMIRSVTFEKSIFAPPPYKFEAGTPNIAGAIGLAAALDYVSAIGIDRIAAHEKELLDYAEAALADFPGLRKIGTAKHKAGLISFVMDQAHPHDIGTIIDQEGVAIRTGHHCAQPVMDRFDVPATARASFGLYNTKAEIDALVTGLHKIVKVFG